MYLVELGHVEALLDEGGILEFEALALFEGDMLEGTFTDIKSKLRVHSGMKKNRVWFFDECISRHYY